MPVPTARVRFSALRRFLLARERLGVLVAPPGALSAGLGCTAVEATAEVPARAARCGVAPGAGRLARAPLLTAAFLGPLVFRLLFWSPPRRLSLPRRLGSGGASSSAAASPAAARPATPRWAADAGRAPAMGAESGVGWPRRGGAKCGGAERAGAGGRPPGRVTPGPRPVCGYAGRALVTSGAAASGPLDHGLSNGPVLLTASG